MTSPTKVSPGPAGSATLGSRKSTDEAKSRRSLAKSVAVSLRRLFTQSLTRQDQGPDPTNITAHSSSSYVPSQQQGQAPTSASDIAKAAIANQRRKTHPVLKRQPSIKHAARRCSVGLDGLRKKGSGGYVPPAPHPLLEAQQSQSTPSSRRGSLKERMRRTCRRISQRMSMRGSTCSVDGVDEEG